MWVQRQHGNGMDDELMMKKTLQELLKRKEDFETRFLMYLKTTKKHTGSLNMRKTCETSYKQEHYIKHVL